MNQSIESGTPSSIAAIAVLLLMVAGVSSLLLNREKVAAFRAGSRRALALARRPWRASDALILGGVLLLFSLDQIAMIVSGGSPQGELPLTFGLHMLALVFFHLLLVLAVLWMARTRVKRWRFAFGPARPMRDTAAALMSLLALFPLALLLQVSWTSLLRYMEIEPTQQALVRAIQEPGADLSVRIYIVVMAVFVVPFSEELLFRGVLFPVALQRMRPWLAATVVSVFFALIHFSLFSFPYLMLLSMMICLVYLLTGRLMAAIIMHAIFNAFNVVMLLLPSVAS